MPLLKLQTNLEIPPDKAAQVLNEMTELVVRELEKPRDYVQVLIEQGCAMLFAGTDAPNAFVELRALDLPQEKAKPLSAALASLLKDKLGIAPERLFINFADIPRPLWGWNATTFG